MSETKKKGWPELGIITRNVVQKKDDNGNWVDVLDKNDKQQFKLGFKLADDITVLRGGEPVALNDSRTGILTDPVKEVENLYKLQFIDEDKIESRRESAKKAHNWLRYKVQLPPPRD